MPTLRRIEGDMEIQNSGMSAACSLKTNWIDDGQRGKFSGRKAEGVIGEMLS